MADADFNALLDKPLDSFEAPKPIPMGSYIGTVTERRFDKSKEKQTPYVQFTIVPFQAMDDVDAGALKESLGNSALAEKKFNLDFYLTKDAMWRLSQFCEDHIGVPGGTPAREAIEACVGQQLVFMVGHTPNKRNPEQVYANITQTAKLPA